MVLHQESSSTGRVGQILQARGFELDIKRPPLGCTLPATLANHAGAIVFGGPMSANDEEPYIAHETDWMAVPLKENRPFLGICLGAQLLVRHLGGAVATEPRGSCEIGWYPIHPTDEGKRVMKWPEMAYQFHREGFDLPEGATLLATSSPTYPNQAFRYGENAWAVQFHAELTEWMMRRWTVKGAHRFDLPNAQGQKEHLEGRLLYDPPLKKWLEDFLEIIFHED